MWQIIGAIAFVALYLWACYYFVYRWYDKQEVLMADKTMNVYTSDKDLIQQMGKDIQTLLGLVKAMILIQKQITNIEYRLGKLEEPKKKSLPSLIIEKDTIIEKPVTKVTAKVTDKKKKENKKKEEEKEVKKEK